jgi:ankyrin repeat protein
VETDKADIDIADAEGRTALLWAAKAGHKGVIRMLIKIGEAKVSSKDIYGHIPLF